MGKLELHPKHSSQINEILSKAITEALGESIHVSIKSIDLDVHHNWHDTPNVNLKAGCTLVFDIKTGQMVCKK